MGLILESKAELRRLIEESKEKIKLKLSSLNDLSTQIELKKKEILDAEKELLKYKPSKIFTRKEIKELAKEKIRKQKEEFENLKHNIGKETEKALSGAKLVRLNAENKSESERREANSLALEMERKALKQEVHVLKCILDEKNQVFQNLLAEKVCKDCILKTSKDNTSELDLNFVKSRAKKLAEQCLDLKKETQDLSFKISKSSGRLKNIIAETRSACEFN